MCFGLFYRFEVFDNSLKRRKKRRVSTREMRKGRVREAHEVQVEEAGPLARGGSRPRAVPGQDAKGHHQLTGWL